MPRENQLLPVDYGTDILTCITYCLKHGEQPVQLQRATVETFHSLLAQLMESTGIDASKCSVMVVSGNTTKVHFLLGLNAWTVFAAPFAPVTADPDFLVRMQAAKSIPHTDMNRFPSVQQNLCNPDCGMDKL